MIVILAIGNEVVSGQILNRNAQFIAEALTKRGYTIAAQAAVRDEISTIKNALKEAFEKGDVVIATGGLGPTIDDLTREAAAEFFDSPLHLDETIKAELIERFKGRVLSVDHQATVPDKAKVIPNHVGTAPGFLFEEGEKKLILMPGIPSEMIAMFNESVIPLIEKLSLPRLHIARICLFNLPESKVDPALRLLKGLEVGIYPQAGILNVILRSSDEAALSEASHDLKKLFAENLFEAESGKIEEAVHDKLTSQRKTLALAESMTGGALSARLTALSGASAYYLGGIVSYSNEAKINLLGVSSALIKAEGAVSEPVAKAMCLGAKERFGSDYALSVTGIAGPHGATDNKPVGLVYCAIASPSGVKTWKLEGRSSRALIIERTINSLLAELYMQLL